MNTMQLLAISPLDGRYAEKLRDAQSLLSEFGLFHQRVVVEIRWLEYLLFQCPEITGHHQLSENSRGILNDLAQNFSLADAERIKIIEKTTNHDVKAVEYFLREKLQQYQEFMPLLEWIHFGCTSEDINNLAYALLLKEAHKKLLLPLIEKIQGKINQFAQEHAAIPMLARTHGQAASPTTVGKEFRVFFARLERQIQSLSQIKILGKFNGAVGNFNAHVVAFPHVDWAKLSQKFVESLGLVFNPLTTQIESHDYLAEYFHNLIRINNILIDLDRDTWGYISLKYFSQKMIAGEVGSSTMPHKVNPIDFENSEGNLAIANAFLDFLSQRLTVSRWQRDLVDSTLMRNMGVALGHSILGWMSLLRGLDKLAVNQEYIVSDLEKHPEVLAEAIQSVMRAHGIAQAYEQLKAATRGQELSLEKLREVIKASELPETEKDRLLKLSPQYYIGLAVTLANKSEF